MLLTQFASAQGSEPLELRSYFGQLDKPEDGCVSIHAEIRDRLQYAKRLARSAAAAIFRFPFRVTGPVAG